MFSSVSICHLMDTVTDVTDQTDRLCGSTDDALTSSSCCHNILHYGRIVSMPSTFRSSTANCVPTRLASALIVATGKTPHNFAIEPGYQLCTCSPLHWYVWTSNIWLSPFRRVAGNQLSIDHIYCRFACRRSNGSLAVN